MAIQKPEDFFLSFEQHGQELIQALNALTSTCGFPVYTSLDVRDAGWKVAVVDVNLFPAGFNILSKPDKERASKKMTEFFSAKLMVPPPWKITLVPEAHTNNQGYLDNLGAVIDILTNAGAEVKLMWPGDPIPKPWLVTNRSGKVLEYLPAELALEGSRALILNHDLSGGIPKSIADVTLPTFPSKQLGWFRRRKSSHQEIADSLLASLGKTFDWFDPWYFSTRSDVVSPVDFSKDEDLEKSAKAVDNLLALIKSDYEARGINETPHVFVKNDAGTYGIGVVCVASGAELIEGGRKTRNKMRMGKESVPISQIILQEAVPTALNYHSQTAGAADFYVAGEPVIYMVNGVPIGGFVRIHEKLGPNARFDSLNQVGSLLEPLECPENPGKMVRPFPEVRGSALCGQLGSRQIYGFLSRLHAIAAGLEECA